MTLTLINLYNECASQPWSMFDSGAESIEDFESAMKISINKAVSYLWNQQPWSFRIQKRNIKTKINQASYNLPDGNLIRKTINGVQRYGIKYNKTYLEYAFDCDLLDELKGEPEKFYIEADKLYIYPVPDDIYQINLSYLLLPYGLNKDEEEIFELVNEDDYINIPEKYEALFKNCVISLAMMYAIADESDENYSGYKQQYDDSLNVLLKYCKNSVIDRFIVW